MSEASMEDWFAINGLFVRYASSLDRGDAAHATCYLLDFRTRGGRTELLSPGVYDCDLLRAQGRWRFTRRDVAMDQAFGEHDL